MAHADSNGPRGGLAEPFTSPRVESEKCLNLDLSHLLVTGGCVQFFVMPLDLDTHFPSQEATSSYFHTYGLLQGP